MDHEGYKYERIDGGITGALRQEAIDRFNGEILVGVASSLPVCDMCSRTPSSSSSSSLDEFPKGD